MPARIDAIETLRAGEKGSSEAVPIKAKLAAPALYVLIMNATDKVGSSLFLPSSSLYFITGLMYVSSMRLWSASNVPSTPSEHIEDQGGDLIIKMKAMSHASRSSPSPH